jgi:hypothetical protein
MDLTLYRGISPDPHPVQVDWDELCGEIALLCAEESEVADKRDLPAIGPYRLREGAARSAAAVEEMASLAVLDLDHDVDVPALLARLEGVDGVVYATPGDTPESRRVRVVVRLDSAHAPSDAGRVRAALAAQLGVAHAHDLSCGNADRIYFAGRLAGTPPREVWRTLGSPLSVAGLLAAAPEPSVRQAAPAPAPCAAPGLAPRVAMRAVCAALGDWTEWPGSKHRLCGALGGVLRRAGWATSECEALLRAWLPTADPHVDVAAGVRYALGAWTRVDCSGLPALAAVIGAERAALLEHAALLPWRARREAHYPDADTTFARSDPPALLRIVDRSVLPPALDWVVPALDLAPGKISAIQGRAFAGKTPYALLLAICVAAGVPFLGSSVRQGPVLYLDHEGGVLTQIREARLCAGLGLSRSGVPLTLAEADSLSAPLLDEIERVIRERRCVLALVDTYSSAIPPGDRGFNDSSFREWATALGRVSRRTGACVVALLHESKASATAGTLAGISGHGGLAGAVQAAIALSRPDECDANRIEVRCARSARRGFAAHEIRWSDTPCADAPEGEALVCERLASEPREEPAPSAPTDALRERSAAMRAREAGERIMRHADRDRWVRDTELVRLSGASARAGSAAVAALLDAGMLERRAGLYRVTEAGASAPADMVSAALGAQCGYTR